MGPKNSFIKLSSLDLYFLAMEDVMTSQGNIFTLRFSTRHSGEEMSRAMRHMVAAVPRLRTLVQPTLFGYRMRVLDNQDRRVDVLYKDAFRVRRNIRVESDEFLACRREVYNEPFTLEQALPFKIDYFCDDTRPLILMNIHHIVGDGMNHLAICNGLMDFLNGNLSPEHPVFNPSIFSIFLKIPWYKLPLQLLRSLGWFIRKVREPRQRPIVNASRRPANFFGPCDMHTHHLPFKLSELRTRAREYDATITHFMLLALSMAFSRGPGRDTGKTIGIRIPLNHRPYFPGEKPVFGNYATSPMIEVGRELWDRPLDMLADIKAQMQSIMQGLQQRVSLFAYLLDSLVIHLLGRKFYGAAAMIARERGLISKTASLTNLGNVDALNAHGPKAQVCEFHANMISYGLFMGMSTVGEDVFMVFTYQDAEFTRDEVKEFIAELERAIRELLDGGIKQ